MTARRRVRLAGGLLGRQRHACGLFDGPEEAAGVVDLFVSDGLRAGERVVHVVEARAPYLARLAADMDIEAALATGQLEVPTWAEAYLAEGMFSAARMTAYVRRALREGRALGYPGTRFIGDMGWAAEGVPGAEQLVAYESGLNAILARPATTVLCSYDANAVDRGRLPALLAAHDAAVVGGSLQHLPESGRDDPRQRILRAASVLFGEDGPSRTGVDALIEAAGVAKATFYRHFPSKDALVLAWLQDEGTRWFDNLRASVESRTRTPQEAIPLLFEGAAQWLEAEDFLGCPYLNAAAEYSDPGNPASVAIRGYLAEIGDYLEQAVAAAGHPDAIRLGRELHVLLAGAITLGTANRTTAHLLSARDAAVALLAATSSPGRHRRRESGR